MNARYREVWTVLREEILQGRYSASAAFPSAVQLARRFNTTRATIRRALDQLRHDGLIGSRQGAGTFVTRRGASRRIGLIVPGVTYSEIFPAIVSEVSRLAQKEGYVMLLGDMATRDTRQLKSRIRRFVGKLVEEKVAGVIFQPLELMRDAVAVNREVVRALDEARIPVVLLDCDIAPTEDSPSHDIAGIDNFAAGSRTAAHLLADGARHFVFVMNPDSDQSIVQRLRGAESAVRAGGGTIAAVDLDPHAPQEIRRLLSRRPRPDAVICRNDSIAAHLIVGLRRMGRSVPDDVRVVGFNDVTSATIVEPALTTTHIPCADVARAAFELLTARIVQPDRPPRTCHLSAPLIVRGSSQSAGCCARGGNGGSGRRRRAKRE
ncbi:MAG: GntR family transcriptional regulator [Kiritimatiellae bacterium]|nr:GntR family transcriptional regulator [Kiritimatiellia bacterium]